MPKRSVAELKEIANELRRTAVTMIYEAQSGHPGGSLSAADLVAALYFKYMHVDPKNPRWEDRDRFVLSKGHVAPIQYAALGKLGYFEESVLHTLRKEGSPLQGHPSMVKCPGIDISTGSLGQGLACAVGMALAGKRDGKSFWTYCMVGDGEAQEGEIWEAANTAHKYRLDNLVVILDVNKLQIDGTTDDVMPNGDLAEKFKAFGFEIYPVDGHDMEAICRTMDSIHLSKNGLPKAIIAQTVKGKGVSYMENEGSWHGNAPNKEQYEQAMADLGGKA